jgi:DUF4097 and DUF4098 domain-containing protein YvlB
MKAREIVFLIFFIAAGVFLYHAQTGKLDIAWDDIFALDWNDYTYEESRVIEPPFPNFLKIENSHGTVEIQGTEGDTITFTFDKRIWRQNEAKARDVADRLHPVVSTDADAVTLSTNREEFKKRNFETSFRLTVPLNMDIDVINSHGLVKAVRVGNATIDNRHGEVVVSEVEGRLDIKNSYEDIELGGVRSDCKVTSRSSIISARQVSGSMTVVQEHGVVRLQDIGGKVTVDAPYSEVVAEETPGPLDIRNSYEKITLRRVGASTIEAHHSAVEADGVTGDLTIDDNYDSLVLNEIKGSLRVVGKSLAVSGKDIVGQEIYISSSHESVDLRDFDGKTTILLSHADLTLRPLPLSGPLEARCDYTPIVFYWPEGEQYPLEAQTKNSDIYWRLPGDVPIQQEDGMTVARAFTELKDRPRILLLTSYGDIQIEKGYSR